MRITDPGHVYVLDDLDGQTPYDENVLVFVKREGEGYPGNTGHYPGTNLQDVLRVCINRINYLDNQIHDPLNQVCKDHLRLALFALESRAAQRHGRTLVIKGLKIEEEPVCSSCGHIGCEGNCRASRSLAQV